MDKPKGQTKPEGRSTVSSSYENWKFRLEKGAEKAFNDRLNDKEGK